MTTIIGACIALFAVLTAAFVGREATRNNAALHALQQERDIELALLDRYAEAVIEATLQTQTWASSTHLKGTTIDQRVEIFGPFYSAVANAKYLALAIVWPDLAATHTEFDGAARAVMQAPNSPTWEAWTVYKELVRPEKTVFAKQIEAVASKRQE